MTRLNKFQYLILDDFSGRRAGSFDGEEGLCVLKAGRTYRKTV